MLYLNVSDAFCYSIVIQLSSCLQLPTYSRGRTGSHWTEEERRLVRLWRTYIDGDYSQQVSAPVVTNHRLWSTSWRTAYLVLKPLTQTFSSVTTLHWSGYRNGVIRYDDDDKLLLLKTVNWWKGNFHWQLSQERC